MGWKGVMACTEVTIGIASATPPSINKSATLCTKISGKLKLTTVNFLEVSLLTPIRRRAKLLFKLPVNDSLYETIPNVIEIPNALPTVEIEHYRFEQLMSSLEGDFETSGI